MSIDPLHLSDSTRKLYEAIIASALPVTVTSGLRSTAQNAAVGGVSGSQHLHGNAIDVSTQGLTDDQRRQLLDLSLANGARGVGIYPSGAMHLDTRAQPAFWGTGGKTSGVDPMSAPSWARDRIMAMLGQGGGGPPAPASYGGGYSGYGGQDSPREVMGVGPGMPPAAAPMGGGGPIDFNAIASQGKELMDMGQQQDNSALEALYAAAAQAGGQIPANLRPSTGGLFGLLGINASPYGLLG